MTDLTPVATLSPVVQLETTDLALGGTGNPMNRQAQALLNRDAFRAAQIAANSAAAAAAAADVVVLRQDLADDTDPLLGAGLSGFDELLDYPASTVGDAVRGVITRLDSFRISILDYEDLVVSKPVPGDRTTWDWTPAIQAAIDASNTAKLDIQNSSIPEIGSRTIVQPVVFFPAGLYRITSSLLLWQGTGSWTSINLMGEEGLGAFIVADDGTGAQVVNTFDLISADGAAAFPGFQTRIKGLHFVGGRRHIHVISDNINTGTFTVEDCSHHTNDPAFYAVHVFSRSTILKINQARVLQCPRFLFINHVDKAILKDSWINGNVSATVGKPADSASISINGSTSDGPSRLAIQGCIFVPDPQGITTEANTRWIDLNGDSAVDITDTHFGLENAGYPIVYTNSPLDSVTAVPYHSDSRVSMKNVTGGSGSSARADAGLVVLRKGVPHIISLDTVCRVASGKLVNSDVMIDAVDAPTTLAAYLASIAGIRTPMLSVSVNNVMAWSTAAIPVELQKYLSGNIPTTHPSGTYPSSAMQPASRIQGFQTDLIADEGVATLLLPSQHGVMIITADGENGGASNRIGATVAICYSSQAASVQADPLWDTTFGDVAAADTTLTGMTGVNGNFTVSVRQGLDFQIENRLGFQSRFRVLFLNTQAY